MTGTNSGMVHVVRVSDRTVTALLGHDSGHKVRTVSASRIAGRIFTCGHESGQLKVWDTDHAAGVGAGSAMTNARGEQNATSTNTIVDLVPQPSKQSSAAEQKQSIVLQACLRSPLFLFFDQVP